MPLKDTVQEKLTSVMQCFMRLDALIAPKYSSPGFLPAPWVNFAEQIKNIGALTKNTLEIIQLDDVDFYKVKKALAHLLVSLKNCEQSLSLRIVDDVSKDLLEMIASIEDALQEIKETYAVVYTDACKPLKHLSLADWLADQNVTAEAVNNILSYLNTLEYTENNLANLYQCLSSHGRLFLNCMKRAFEQNNLNVEILQELSNALNVIEIVSSPPAHFIWVGPPSKNENELLGVRSLCKTMSQQTKYFWVLDEHVAAYEKRFEALGLKNIEVVSIENYAKKIDLKFGKDKDSTLLQEIAFFKKIAQDNVERALTFQEGSSERKLAMTHAIRDRVTIVDHVKPLIALFEGGYIFDVDLIVSSSETVLPELGRWTFPKMNGITHDVWFIFCHPSLDWKGNEARYLEDKDIPDEIRTERNFYVMKYNERSRDIYVRHDSSDARAFFPSDLGDAICGIGNSIPSGFMDDAKRALNEDLDTVNDYHLIEQTRDKWNNSFKETTLCSMRDANKSFVLSLPLDVHCVKYYGQSYIPTKESPEKFIPGGVNQALLFIKDAAIFQSALSARCQFANLNVAYVFDVNLQAKLSSDASHLIIRLENVTLLHLALLARPDLFDLILNETALYQLPEILAQRVESQDSDWQKKFGASTLDLSELASALLKHTPADSPALEGMLAGCAKKINELVIVSRIFQALPDEIKRQWKDKKNLSEILDVILDEACRPEKIGLFSGSKLPLQKVLYEQFKVSDFSTKGNVRAFLLKSINLHEDIDQRPQTPR